MNLANRITLTRILLIPFFVMSLLVYKPYSGIISYLPLIIFIVCVFTDALDGLIARRLNQITKLGTILDPIADKLLLITAFIALSIEKDLPVELKLPSWVLLIVISRDIIIIIGSMVVILVTGDLHIKPSIFGKITTFFQMLTIISILFQLDKSFIIWDITAVFTVISGTDYVLKGSKMLSDPNHSHPNTGFHINLKNFNNFKI